MKLTAEQGDSLFFHESKRETMKKSLLMLLFVLGLSCQVLSPTAPLSSVAGLVRAGRLPHVIPVSVQVLLVA